MIPGPGISFEQVRVNLGGSDVLAGISFEVRPGTIHALIGPNGGGKTTLVRALLGQTAHEGRIAIHGGTVSWSAMRHKRSISTAACR